MNSDKQLENTGSEARSDQKTYDLMANTAADRAAMWDICAGVLERPTSKFVNELRADAIAPQIRAATAWLGDEFEAKDVIGALGAFAGRSNRFSAEDDLAELTREWDAWLENPDVEQFIAQSSRDARAEEDAWRKGELEAAKTLRATQFQAIDDNFQQLVAWSENADENTSSLVVQVLVRIVAAHITAESGRNLLGRLERQRGHLQMKFD